MSLDDRSVLRTATLEQLIENGRQRLGAIPGVLASGASCCMPLENDMRLRMNIVGRPLEGAYHAMASWRSVSTGYFDALKIPVLRGRQFTDQDRLGTAGVVIVNQTMARQLWPAGDPLSDSIQIGKGLGPNFAVEPTRRIVGIVGDVRDAALDAEPRPTVYVPIAQLPDPVMRQTMSMLPLTWIVRTSAPTQALSRAIGDELQRLGSSPIAEGQRLSEVMRQATSDSNFYLVVMAVLAGAALLLAVIGLNGVMSYAVQLRTKEIGVRLALGAESTQVRNMIVSHGMRLVLVAIAAGTGWRAAADAVHGDVSVRRESARRRGVHRRTDGRHLDVADRGVAARQNDREHRHAAAPCGPNSSGEARLPIAGGVNASAPPGVTGAGAITPAGSARLSTWQVSGRVRISFGTRSVPPSALRGSAATAHKARLDRLGPEVTRGGPSIPAPLLWAGRFAPRLSCFGPSCRARKARGSRDLGDELVVQS